MHNCIKRICFVFVIIASFAMPLPVVASEEAFVLTQTHYFHGRWNVSVNKDRVKATNIQDRYSIISMAPSWKVVFYQEDSHKAFATTMASFLHTGLQISAGYVIQANVKNAVTQKSTYKGVPATMYTFYRSDMSASRPAWTLGNMPLEAAVQYSKYWVAPLISSDPNVCHLLQKLFMVPIAPGYPVAFVDTRTDKTSNAVLNLLSCKAFPPADVQIAYPTNYKLCKEQRDITISLRKKQNLDEWAETLGK